MNTLQSLWLIRELYFKKGLPDLEKIQSLGLLAVKIGQIHALRLDFLPPEKCHHLSTLYRSNIPVAREDIRALIQEQGGETFTRSFAQIDEQPLATASVGEVYRATLLSGEKVVVKFIKSRFAERFTSDVMSVRRFFKIILFLFPRLRRVGDPLGILADIETYTIAELDLRNESAGAALLEGIAHEYDERFDLSMLGFVKHYPQMTNARVMVSEYIDAPSVDELLARGSFSYDDLLKLFAIQGFYMFIAGKFHGDLHPGNVLYDGSRFYFVDTAFVGEVGERIRSGLFHFFEALSRYDYPLCAERLNEMAEVRISGEAFRRFQEEFKVLYANYTDSTVSEVSLTRQMMLTIKLGVNSGMRFEKGIFPIIRSLMYLDGMVLRTNPDAVLVRDMRPFIEHYEKVMAQ